ncbi:helicase domain protein [Thermovirga lienii DSM 17291]|jgi:SNF2 family DNA or RNA helicase|uniref:Helicase domain protein n=1 Tax=Thermovirga lienii (strain ATCC BAA-1197 / DSM 17291 / Cas60314) TaxID=580340 RepID=G7V613_THELD|nr:helicase-related protein [Thermovirga lienii]AER67000.1 helicase domain protein [Thermovirga lienii DSM 17291]
MELISAGEGHRFFSAFNEESPAAKQASVAASDVSVFGLERFLSSLNKLQQLRLIVPTNITLPMIQGNESDRRFRNMLQSHWIARRILDKLKRVADVRESNSSIQQGVIILSENRENPLFGAIGSLELTTCGLGITPANTLGIIQVTSSPEEIKPLLQWFDNQWSLLPNSPIEKVNLIQKLEKLCQLNSAGTIFALILKRLFQDRGDIMDEESVVKSATGIHQTTVWRKLYKFQKDAVVGAIDKLNRYGGCIIADSVGLGKTFEALAIIKYYELRNDRVLVLTPKRLRENWTLYRANDKRNPLVADRFNYDVLNHTDLSRDRGMSGDVDLEHVNWGNYDLVVIDESHNFRNKVTYKDRESRYDRLMRRIIREGVKTRVLMLSATPVNNRLADLKNQIAFITEGKDDALWDYGIKSIEVTTRNAQKQFNRWMGLPEGERTPGRLIEMLGFDYFKLLDLLTIARSRKHIEKYYGIAETGKFPERLKPINVKTDVDTQGVFPSIEQVNREIRKLNLAAYAPLRYLLESKREEYDAKYSTKVRGGESIFRQVDREESLIQLMRVNLLKRMESSVHAFALTVARQIADIEALLEKIDNLDTREIEELDINDIDIDDPTFESLLAGRKVKVLLSDVDLIRWKQDLLEDRNRLKTLLAAAHAVTPELDAKLCALKEVIRQKIENPINPGNRKVLIFSAFADTANYLYQHLAHWAQTEFGLNSALVTGSSGIKTTLPNLRKDMISVLTAFAPRAKERPIEFASQGEIDLLIATDCISEGQNLQDCDWLINYDIHWNPVRIIQRFGRIDRIGSPNTQIQLVNFWPNMELDEYINLEARVSGRMVLLDVSATGEENLIEVEAGDPMNDLEYRRRQLLKLQETVIDLEDLSSGISITDLTLSDYRMELAEYLKEHPDILDDIPLGAFAVTTTADLDVPPGIVFCLQVVGDAAGRAFEPNYPLAPYALVHVSMDGVVHLPYTQAKQILDVLKHTCIGKDLPDQKTIDRWMRQTKNGADMRKAQKLLAEAVTSIAGKSQERAIESLFKPGGTYAQKGEFAGQDDIEVVAWLVILPEDEG